MHALLKKEDLRDKLFDEKLDEWHRERMPSLVLDYDESVGIKSAIKILGGRWNKAETVELLIIARHSKPHPHMALPTY